MASLPDKWQAFAWQGIQLEVPERWNPAAMEGEAADGYVRLDDDEDVRLQIRWRTSRKPQSPSRIVDHYLKMTQGRRGGKTSGDGRTRRNTSLVRLPDTETECFQITGDPVEFGMAVQCGRCRRHALLSLLSARGRPEKSLARRIFGSYSDEPQGELVPWAVYGFRFATPLRFSMSDYAANAGRLAFAFRHGRTRLRAIRVSLAETLLRDHALVDWVRKDVRKDFSDWVMAWPTGTDVREFTATGRRRRLAGWCLRRHRAWCRVRHAPAANALYIAEWFGRERDEDAFNAFAASLDTGHL